MVLIPGIRAGNLVHNSRILITLERDSNKSRLINNGTFFKQMFTFRVNCYSLQQNVKVFQQKKDGLFNR